MYKLTEVLLDILTEKKLCKKGRAYYDRRRAAGEKPSAYLSGRAVKVCKGLMEENAPQSGESSGAPAKFKTGTLPEETKFLTLDQILQQVKDIPYYKEVLDDLKKEDESWGVTKKVKEYAEYMKKNPSSLKNLPPLIIIDGKFQDGAHRTSAIYLLQNLLDPKNPFWKTLKLKVEFWNSKNLNESLRDWFKKEDWVRIDTAGNITGDCGTMKKGKKTTRCLPRAKANSLTKDERAATSKKKAASNKQFVPNTKKAKVKLKEVEDQTIECEKCGWRWKLSDGGEDPFLCHKCGYDNSYRYNDDIEEYDVENEQDLKEFISFIKEYNQVLSEGCDCLLEAEYHGRKVQLGKPMQGDIKKFKVYVKNPKGKVVKVNFGFGGSSAKGKRMNIKKNNPVRRKAFRARHNCDNPGPRTKARYWSCRAW
jgi:hypothetical protein